MMVVKNKTVSLKRLADLVAQRAAKYHCGFRTAFIQWTSEEEKRGVTYHELKAFVIAQQRFDEED